MIEEDWQEILSLKDFSFLCQIVEETEGQEKEKIKELIISFLYNPVLVSFFENKIEIEKEQFLEGTDVLSLGEKRQKELFDENFEEKCATEIVSSSFLLVEIFYDLGFFSRFEDENRLFLFEQDKVYGLTWEIQRRIEKSLYDFSFFLTAKFKEKHPVFSSYLSSLIKKDGVDLSNREEEFFNTIIENFNKNIERGEPALFFFFFCINKLKTLNSFFWTESTEEKDVENVLLTNFAHDESRSKWDENNCYIGDNLFWRRKEVPSFFKRNLERNLVLGSRFHGIADLGNISKEIIDYFYLLNYFLSNGVVSTFCNCESLVNFFLKTEGEKKLSQIIKNNQGKIKELFVNSFRRYYSFLKEKEQAGEENKVEEKVEKNKILSFFGKGISPKVAALMYLKEKNSSRIIDGENEGQSWFVRNRFHKNVSKRHNMLEEWKGNKFEDFKVEGSYCWSGKCLYDFEYCVFPNEIRGTERIFSYVNKNNEVIYEDKNREQECFFRIDPNHALVFSHFQGDKNFLRFEEFGLVWINFLRINDKKEVERVPYYRMPLNTETAFHDLLNWEKELKQREMFLLTEEGLNLTLEERQIVASSFFRPIPFSKIQKFLLVKKEVDEFISEIKKYKQEIGIKDKELIDEISSFFEKIEEQIDEKNNEFSFEKIFQKLNDKDEKEQEKNKKIFEKIKKIFEFREKINFYFLNFPLKYKSIFGSQDKNEYLVKLFFSPISFLYKNFNPWVLWTAFYINKKKGMETLENDDRFSEEIKLFIWLYNLFPKRECRLNYIFAFEEWVLGLGQKDEDAPFKKAIKDFLDNQELNFENIKNEWFFFNLKLKLNHTKKYVKDVKNMCFLFLLI